MIINPEICSNSLKQRLLLRDHCSRLVHLSLHWMDNYSVVAGNRALLDQEDLDEPSTVNHHGENGNGRQNYLGRLLILPPPAPRKRRSVKSVRCLLLEWRAN
jgi:hypothetical protein